MQGRIVLALYEKFGDLQRLRPLMQRTLVPAMRPKIVLSATIVGGWITSTCPRQRNIGQVRWFVIGEIDVGESQIQGALLAALSA